jgi:hypothetical protein
MAEQYRTGVRIVLLKWATSLYEGALTDCSIVDIHDWTPVKSLLANNVKLETKQISRKVWIPHKAELEERSPRDRKLLTWAEEIRVRTLLADAVNCQTKQYLDEPELTSGKLIRRNIS